MRFITLITLLCQFCFGAEIDSFTLRFDRDYQDAGVVVNAKFNQMFDEALVDANKVGFCNHDRLYSKLRDRFRNMYRSEFIKWLKNTDEIDSYAVPKKESFFKDFTVKDAFVMGLFGNRKSLATAVIMKIDDFHIGTDKFEHFFSRGFYYYKRYYLQNWPIEKVLKYGFEVEKGYLGAGTTGIMSWADLNANFDGMRFWNHLLSYHPDMIGEEKGPYIRCTNEGKWERTTTEIDLISYVHGGWDESINCSQFKNERILNYFNTHMKQLNSLSGTDVYQCPLESEKHILSDLETKYGDFSKWLINTQGPSIIDGLTAYLKMPYHFWVGMW